MLHILRAGNKRTKTIWWVLIIVTVVTFVGGFVFLLGSGLSSGFNARASGAVGTVNGDAISRTDFTNALAEQRENYKRQYGTDPVDRDLKMIEVQTWRSLVYQRLLAQQAKQAGLRASDPEIVEALKTQPPTMLQNAPTFQTDGKFDYAKYQQALRDPNNNWAPFEQMMRDQLPTRKFQERLLASIKMSEPELLDTYRERFDRVDATLVEIGPDMTGEAPKVAEADLQRTFEKHKSRFIAGARTDLEVLIVPKKFGAEETRAAHEMADGLARRVRAGEDFSMLARDYSEGPAADRGGVVNRTFKATDFEPSLGAKIAALVPGQILDPFQDQSRFVIIQRIAPDSTTPPDGIRIAQIVVRVRPNEDQMRLQLEQTKKWRAQARGTGLGKVAASNGLATFTTGPYNLDNTPQQLSGAPEVADWGLTAKLNELSPVFEGAEEFIIAQVVRQEGAGPAKRAEIEQNLRQLAELDARIQRAKPKSDAVAQALKQGRSLEEAGAAAGVPPIKVTGVTRVSPDPRIANAPEVVGALFGAKPGQVVGPIETVSGWFFARVDQFTPADTVAFTAMKPQLMGELLEKRQRAFLGAYLGELRRKAKIQDLRVDASN